MHFPLPLQSSMDVHRKVKFDSEGLRVHSPFLAVTVGSSEINQVIALSITTSLGQSTVPGIKNVCCTNAQLAFTEHMIHLANALFFI